MTKKPNSPSSKELNSSISTLMEQLDQVIADIEGNSKDIDFIVAKFEEGIALSNKIKQKISHSENKINILKANLEENISELDQS